MKITQQFKTVTVECICILFILLFVYAAVNKLLDFQNFQVQVAQSPLLTSFAFSITWAVPIIEIIIAALLCIPKTKLLALYASFTMMVLFTAYIVIILNFSPFVPCSCGGILEKMNWNQHLLFNICFCILAVPAILLQSKLNLDQFRPLHISLTLIVLIICSAATLAALFLLSEDMFHKRNNFTRRFPLQPAEYLSDYKLPPKSYIAGAGNGKVYIGSNNDHLKIIELDKDLKFLASHKIITDDPERIFRRLHVTVEPPFFYVSDGVEAFTFRGKVRDWKGKMWIDQLAYFNSFVPIDSQRVAVRVVDSKSESSVIGVMQRKDTNRIFFNKQLLDKQVDGFFDVDGILLYNKKHKKVIYVYRYRNEYVLTDDALRSKIIGNTIDTTSKSNIKVAYIESLKDKKIASPMRIVNKFAATDGDFLFVNSKLIGQMESRRMWDRASIVDVYNIKTRTYQFSFYLYDQYGKKVTEFTIADGRIYTIAGSTMSVYSIDPVPFKNN